MVPNMRLRRCNDAPVRPGAGHVLYWMTSARRTGWNLGLQRALDHATEWDRPLVVLEALRCDYPWASDRLHRFVLQGMRDNALALAEGGVTYFPYVEPSRGAGRGLLGALAEDACVVVTDDYPAFILPRMLRSAAEAVPVRLEAVDSNGLLPLRASDRVFPTAYSFRRFLHRALPEHLDDLPTADPLADAALPEMELPAAIVRRWPSADASLLESDDDGLRPLPIDHSVSSVAYEGGRVAGLRTLDRFLDARLDRYADERNQPEEDVTSELSPYLHFGHVSAHEVFDAVADREGWNEGQLGEPNGSRKGWWGMSEPAEAFLDELVTWREVGFNRCALSDDYDRYESLPEWALTTLDDHADDPRDHAYDLERFENATTHDPLWNAAQVQLSRQGRIHNYLRMLWGKKILEWSASPRDALDVMIELNNKYAVDGRDPNSYSGIFWVLGRYDRAWGPERPIFGKEYLRRYAVQG